MMSLREQTCQQTCVGKKWKQRRHVRCHDTTGRLDTERKRRNVDEQDLVGLLGRVARQDGGLDSGPVGDCFVGVDRLVGLLAVEEV